MSDYSVLKDEELVEKAQSGDVYAAEVVIERSKNLVKAVTRSYFLVGGDSEDLLQEGIIGVFKAIQGYNGKSSFKSFAYLCIKNSVLTAIKNSNRDKHKPLNNCISLTSDREDIDKMEIFVNSEAVNPETRVIDEETEKELKQKIRLLLSGYEYSILALFLKGFSYREIGEQLHKESKSIDNALQRIRKKLENDIR